MSDIKLYFMIIILIYDLLRVIVTAEMEHSKVQIIIHVFIRDRNYSSHFYSGYMCKLLNLILYTENIKYGAAEPATPTSNNEAAQSLLTLHAQVSTYMYRH